MEDMHEGDIVYHKSSQARCTIVSLFNGRATVRTEDNMVLECELQELAIELDTMNLF